MTKVHRGWVHANFFPEFSELGRKHLPPTSFDQKIYQVLCVYIRENSSGRFVPVTEFCHIEVSAVKWKINSESLNTILNQV